MAKSKKSEPKQDEPKTAPVAQTAPGAQAATEPLTEPVTTPAAAPLDPAQIGSGDDIAPPEAAGDDSVVSGDGSGEAPPPLGSDAPEPAVDADPGAEPPQGDDSALAEDAGEPAQLDTADYRVFLSTKPLLQTVPGHVKRRNFDLDATAAAKLNKLWGAMQAANVVGPDGVKVNTPDRAIAVLIHIVHDSAAD